MNEPASPETGLTPEQLESRYGASATIDFFDELQIGYWADRLDVSEHQLRGAIVVAGPRIKSIALALGVEDPGRRAKSSASSPPTSASAMRQAIRTGPSHAPTPAPWST